MANDIRQKGVEITLDKKRRLLFDLNALCDLEDKFGDINSAFKQIANGSMKGIRTLLHIGLVHEDESLSERDAGKLIALADIAELSQKLTKSMTQGLPKVEDDDVDEKNQEAKTVD
ncbi:hypothetical protein SAMN02745945_01826 [Peptoclostridium litorale DSM 5388]|uniref:Uncharacterized protein n=1 Tax=Peptoclostridium litorale DSM 5388 TaxID=1121324 RepID=A0A069RIC7_PEPLI|nr:hypothetical protein [Peptoclostridium litorale]KDR95900.1 hypothetical protein CLIT_8c00690 [Peptoclostridium litorale DSM 5388]SIO10381.1 hypothetical protein SAMN02745945_01826 [Peptoclostridium litorale DSM 5388]